MQNISDQVSAVRSGAGCFDPFPREILAARGKDRAAFLHRVLSHDIKGLPVGQGRAACLLDRQGKILFAALVHARPEEILLDFDPYFLSGARSQLEKYAVADAVEFISRTEEIRTLHLHGPAAAAQFQSLFPNLSWPAHSLESVAGVLPAGFSGAYRWDLLGMPGLVVWVQPNHKLKIQAPLCIPETFHALRIEAGVPWPGKEIQETVILNELGSEEWMSFTKGCYVGQEIVARIKYRAHPPRLLTGFTLDQPVPEGSALYQGEEAVGTLTSVCDSPTMGKPIALGFLKHGTPAGPLRIGSAGRPATALPTPLPFVSKPPA